MKTLISIVVFALVLSAAPVDTKGDKDAVLAAMDTYKQGLLHKDGAALSRVLSDDLDYTHSQGKFETKADVIKSITSGATVVQRLEFSDTTVRVYGNMALVKARVDLWHSDKDIRHMNVLHVFVKGPPGWQMVARQATNLAK